MEKRPQRSALKQLSRPAGATFTQPTASGLRGLGSSCPSTCLQPAYTPAWRPRSLGTRAAIDHSVISGAASQFGQHRPQPGTPHGVGAAGLHLNRQHAIGHAPPPTSWLSLRHRRGTPVVSCFWGNPEPKSLEARPLRKRVVYDRPAYLRIPWSYTSA